MSQSGDVPLLTNIFSVYVIDRNFEETDETRGEITRLDENHEEVLLLFKFIFVSTTYSALSFYAIGKNVGRVKLWIKTSWDDQIRIRSAFF